MIGSILQRLRLPEARELRDLDGYEAAVAFRRIIQRKGFLRTLYEDHYRELLAEAGDRRPLVELGSGSGFLGRFCPEAITSDLLPAPGLDARFSALELPLRDASVGTLLMVDVFHHVPDSARFLAEMTRVVRPGGRVVMLETAHTPFSRQIFQRFHHEAFEPDIADWKLPLGGARSTANQALPWVVFCRDRERFEREFPALRLRRLRLHTPLRYLLSGGLSMRQLLPTRLYPVIRSLEQLMEPIMGWCAMFMTITLERVDTGERTEQSS